MDVTRHVLITSCGCDPSRRGDGPCVRGAQSAAAEWSGAAGRLRGAGAVVASAPPDRRGGRLLTFKRRGEGATGARKRRGECDARTRGWVRAHSCRLPSPAAQDGEGSARGEAAPGRLAGVGVDFAGGGGVAHEDGLVGREEVGHGAKDSRLDGLPGDLVPLGDGDKVWAEEDVGDAVDPEDGRGQGRRGGCARAREVPGAAREDWLPGVKL